MKRVLTIIILLSIISTSFLVFNRAQVEIANQTYEIIVPYDEIKVLIDNGVHDVYEKLAGNVQAIAVEPTVSLLALETENKVHILEKHEILKLHGLNGDLIQQKSGLYIIPTKIEDNLIKRIKLAYGNAMIKDDVLSSLYGKPVFFIHTFDGKTIISGGKSIVNPDLKRPLGFNLDLITKHHDLGFTTVFRIGNNITSSNAFVLEDILKIHNEYGDNQILFTGSEVLELTNPSINDHILKMRDKGFTIMPIEFFHQRGFDEYQQLFKHQVIRVHSLDPFNGRGGYEKRASRAVFERNIRALYFHITSSNELSMQSERLENSFQYGLETIKGTHKMLENQKFSSFNTGIANPYPPLKESVIMKIIALLGITSFAGLGVLLFSRKLSLLIIAGLSSLSFIYILSDARFIEQGLALITTILAATYAVISAKHVKRKNIYSQYFYSLAIALVGAWFVVVLLYGNEYLMKFEEFRGVKLLYITPIAIISVLLIKHIVIKFANEPIRFYHLAILGGFILLIQIYLMRSGNNPSIGVSNLELTLRDLLENTLGIRPRTKEFLIGFPTFMLAMYLVSKGVKWGQYLFIIATVGMVSMVNTFTHLHIPLYISLIRTLYGAILGLIIGVGLIYSYKLIANKLLPLIKERL